MRNNNLTYWITNKIRTYLRNKEGVDIVEQPVKLTEAETLLIRDAFGFQYELTVKLVGRTQQMPTGLERRIMDIKEGV